MRLEMDMTYEERSCDCRLDVTWTKQTFIVNVVELKLLPKEVTQVMYSHPPPQQKALIGVRRMYKDMICFNKHYW